MLFNNALLNTVQLNPPHVFTRQHRALTQLRQEVNNQAAVLGFIGSPWTLATYIIEGGSSSLYKNIKVVTRVKGGVTQGEGSIPKNIKVVTRVKGGVTQGKGSIPKNIKVVTPRVLKRG